MLLTSKYVSFVIQVITGIIGIYALTHSVPQQHQPIKQSLSFEMTVQLIQFFVYLYLILKFKLSNMAKIRYIDWFITTPIMLLSLMLFFKYEAKRRKNEETHNTLQELFTENKRTIYIALTANFIMLTFGVLGEFKYLSRTTSTIMGLFALATAFFVIWKDLASFSTLGSLVFVPFAFVWSLYGIAFNLDEVSKNVFYNILDICAKNMFGLFLSYKTIKISYAE